MAQFISDDFKSGGTGQGTYILEGISAAAVPLTVKAYTGQTANVFEIKNAAGTTLFSVDYSGNVTYLGDEYVTDALTVNGNASVTGTLTITGASTLSSTLSVAGAATFDSGINVTGDSFIEGTTRIHSLRVEGDLNLQSGYIRSLYSANLHLLPGPSCITIVGDAGTTSHTLNTNDDLFVTGRLEVDGFAYFDGGSSAGGVIFGDDTPIYLGTSNDVSITWNTTQTVDGWYFGTATGQNTLIIAEIGDIAYDFAHGAQINPTVFIHSAAQNTTQWLSLAHDQTNAIIASGVGDILFTAAGANVAPSANDGAALGSATLMWADLFLADAGVINWNNGNYTVTHSAGLLTTNGALTIVGALAGVTTFGLTGDITVTSAATTTNTLAITADALTSGGMISAVSNSADVTARKLLFVHNDNAVATGANPAYIQNDSTGYCILVYPNNVAGQGITVSTGAVTTGVGMFVGSFNSGTTFTGFQSTSNSTAITSGRGLLVNLASSGAVIANKTGDWVSITSSRTDARTTGTTADDYDALSIIRTSVTTGVGGTMTATGSVAYFQNISTQTAGTLTDTTKVLELDQAANSSGDVINITNAGTGNDITGTSSTWSMTKGGVLAASSIGVTGTRITNGFFTSLAVTNAITGSVTGNAGTLTVADSSSATCYVGLYEAASGSIAGFTDAGITYNASTATLTVTNLGATTLSGSMTLAENVAIIFDPAIGTTHNYCALAAEIGLGGATIAIGDIVSQHTDGEWYLADCSIAHNTAGDARRRLGIALTTSADGAAITVMLRGKIRHDDFADTLLIGDVVYVSTTAGAVTVTQPATTDDVIRIIGHGVTADELDFNPSSDWITKV